MHMLKRKKVMIILTAAVIVIAAYFIFSWVMAREAIQQYCSQLSKGTSVETARNMALQKDLRFISSRSANAQGAFIALVTSSGVMGRYVCKIDHDGQTVTKATLSFND
jgi:hypothetical protein